jgi:hypothetical protein
VKYEQEGSGSRSIGLVLELEDYDLGLAARAWGCNTWKAGRGRLKLRERVTKGHRGYEHGSHGKLAQAIASTEGAQCRTAWMMPAAGRASHERLHVKDFFGLARLALQVVDWSDWQGW